MGTILIPFLHSWSWSATQAVPIMLISFNQLFSWKCLNSKKHHQSFSDLRGSTSPCSLPNCLYWFARMVWAFSTAPSHSCPFQKQLNSWYDLPGTSKYRNNVNGTVSWNVEFHLHWYKKPTASLYWLFSIQLVITKTLKILSLV